MLPALVLLSTVVLRQEAPAPAPAPQEAPQTPPQAPPAPQREVVGDVKFEGSTRVPLESLRLQIRTKAGLPYSAETVDRDLKMLAARLGIWAESRLERLPDGKLQVVFTLTEVPSVRRVQFVGNDNLDEEDLREALGLSEHGTLQVLQPAGPGLGLHERRLEEKYREKGYLYCEIDARIERQGEELVLVFTILEGPEVHVDEVDFVGLEEFAPRHLRSLMKTSRSFWFFTQTFKRKDLDGDLVQIEQFLHDEGYLDARVAVESVTPASDGEEVDVLIRIDQGPRYKVRKVEFAGNSRLSTEELQALIKMAPGITYRQTVYRKDRDRILERYGKLGYIRAWLPDKPIETYVGTAEVDLTYRVSEDEPKRVRDVRVVGNTKTKDEVVRRELDLHPGELFDSEEVDRAEDRLRAAGFFADERGQPMAWVTHETTDDPTAEDVLMRVQEGQSGLFSLVGGLSSGSGFFVGADVSIENFDLFDLPSSPLQTIPEFLDQRAFHGAGQKLRLSANPGNETSRYILDFREPYLTGPVRQPVFLDVNLHIVEYVSRFYDEDTEGAIVSVGRQLSRETSVSLGVRRDRITIEDIENRQDPIEDLLAVEGGNSLQGLVGSWSWQRLDSLRNPTQGITLGVYSEWLGGPWGLQYDLIKATTTGEVLVPVWENEEEQRHVLAFRGAFALVDPYGDTKETPYFERYRAGGPAGLLKMRGFEADGIGPHDGSFSERGSAGWVVNTEYVFPLIETYDARLRESVPFLRGVVFCDQGMLEEDWDALQDGKWRLSVGAGLRIKIPFQLLSMPLEIYYGVPLQKAGDDERESFQINFVTRF